MTQREGLFTIPTRVYVSEEHRALLQRLVLREGLDLPDLLSELLAQHLDAVPEQVATPSPTTANTNVAAELLRMRAELTRLQERQRNAQGQPLHWLADYIANLEAEIRRLEAR